MRTAQKVKKCTKCGVIKPRSEFYKKTETTIQPACKTCFTQLNKDYYLKNKHKIVVKKKEYYNNHKEIIISRITKWNKNNPDKRVKYMVVVNAVRRGRKLANGGSFTAKEWKDLIVKHNNKCYYCGCTGKLTIDHFIPLSKGGTNSINNIVPACGVCNTLKGNKLPEQWLQKNN